MRFFFCFFLPISSFPCPQPKHQLIRGLYLTQGWVFLQESRNWFFHSSIFVSLFLERSTQSFLTPLDNDHPTCPRYSGSITSAGRRSLWASWQPSGSPTIQVMVSRPNIAELLLHPSWKVSPPGIKNLQTRRVQVAKTDGSECSTSEPPSQVPEKALGRCLY